MQWKVIVLRWKGDMYHAMQKLYFTTWKGATGKLQISWLKEWKKRLFTKHNYTYYTMDCTWGA